MALDFIEFPFEMIPGHDAPPPASPPALTLHVRMPDGGWLSLFAAAGTNVGEALRGFGVPVRVAGRAAEAGFRPSTRLQSPWRRGADDDGTRMLSDLMMTPELDGVAMELPWEAIELQTSWVAG